MRRGVPAAGALALLAACAGGGGREPRVHAVEIRNFRFEPAALAAAPGDTVVFTNRDAVPHTATAADTAWDSGAIAGNGGAWRLVVPAGGGGEYVCAYHPNMRATLTVE